MTLKELLVALDGDYEVAVYNLKQDEKDNDCIDILTPMNVFKYEDRVVNSFKIWKPKYPELAPERTKHNYED